MYTAPATSAKRPSIRGHMTNGLNPDGNIRSTRSTPIIRIPAKSKCIPFALPVRRENPGADALHVCLVRSGDGDLYAASVRSMRLVQGILSGRALPTPTVWRWTLSDGRMARRCAHVSVRIRATTGSCPIRVSAPRTSRFRLSAKAEQIHRGRLKPELLPQKFGQPAPWGIQQFVAP